MLWIALSPFLGVPSVLLALCALWLLDTSVRSVQGVLTRARASRGSTRAAAPSEDFRACTVGFR